MRFHDFYSLAQNTKIIQGVLHAAIQPEYTGKLLRIKGVQYRNIKDIQKFSATQLTNLTLLHVCVIITNTSYNNLNNNIA